MNLKRIIREEMEDDWGWAKEIDPNSGIVLKPNTMYFFEPPLIPDEVENFAYRISNSNYIQGWLLGRIPELIKKYGGGNTGIKYFVTGNDINNRLRGWCTEYPIEMARLNYSSSGFINARKEFNL